MGETTGTGMDEAETAAERLEAALARIAAGLSQSTRTPDAGLEAAPGTAQLAARLDELIERVRAELAAD